MSDRDLLCIRSEGLVPMTMHELADLITDLSRRASYDKHFEKGSVIAAMPLDTKLLHVVFKKVMVVGPRDIITV